MRILDETKEFLMNFKVVGFHNSVATAKELAEELEMSPTEMTFECERSMRRRKKKVLFDYEAQDEPIVDPVDNFRISFFYSFDGSSDYVIRTAIFATKGLPGSFRVSFQYP